MMSLAKPEALQQLQQLFGGQAAPDAAMAAGVPEAKQAFELARQVSAAEAGAEAAADVQPGADRNGTGSLDGTEAAQAAAGAADLAAGSQPEPVYVARRAAASGAASLLPESLQARLPATTLVSSQQQLQQLVAQLQQHQVRCPGLAALACCTAVVALLVLFNTCCSTPECCNCQQLTPCQ